MLFGSDFVQLTILPQVLSVQDIEEKVNIFSSGLYSFFGSNFGYIHRVQKSTKRTRRHDRKMKQLRVEKNKARRKYRERM